ncbi:SIMPL domain-containing protein [Caulobacter sp. 17J65-9]|uniref:SIMPL domain-containing protein n=1 Tax=Caulobacter sp. 17J65-9 TaxID=2709382 RepID=UPI0013CA4477|nr:SIMPL domain-containing protein [Caulobacter sp. 17J65-9]NEX94110.1 SIMPL domain-containing protein [Caulobacter sp. 17J65-9]
MKALLRSAALAGVLLAVAAPAALAQSGPMPPEGGPHMMMRRGPVLNLSAYGETRVAPDMATISLGVTTEAPTAADAMRQNRERMTQMMAALKKQGVAEKDIQTSGLNLSPQYTYRENQPPLLRGYQASNQVTVIVYDLTKLGQAVDATVAAGGNQVNGISFGLRDPQTAENAARVAAVKALKAKADLYAGATGLRIKGLQSLSEGGGYSAPPPMPVPMFKAARAEAMDSTPIAGGELVLRVDVQGVYEME